MLEASDDMASPYDLLCMPAVIILCLIRLIKGSKDDVLPIQASMHIMAQHALARDIFCNLAELAELYNNEQR